MVGKVRVEKFAPGVMIGEGDVRVAIKSSEIFLDGQSYVAANYLLQRSPLRLNVVALEVLENDVDIYLRGTRDAPYRQGGLLAWYITCRRRVRAFV
jgi:hypothetical protein